MKRYSLSELEECARREVGMRQRVYPRWVESGKMSKKKAEEEVEKMQQIADTLRRLRLREPIDVVGDEPNLFEEAEI